MARYLSAWEAAKMLGISVNTLYSYVSRGLVRSEEVTEGNRKRYRRYYAEDVDNLVAKKESAHNPEKVAENALHWGTPMLDSAITLIKDNRLFYRGYDAIELAKSSSVEEVAMLIWTGDPQGSSALFKQPATPQFSPYGSVLAAAGDLSPLQKFQMLMPMVAAHDLAAYELRPDNVARTGARILQFMAMAASQRQMTREALAGSLQKKWCPHHPDTARFLSAALILCADHEFNASSFAARITAAAGSNPYGVVSAGLAALQGVKHGGYTERVEIMLRDLENVPDIRTALSERLRYGEQIPGFGHRLYPKGDPRATLLLKMLRDHYPAAPAVNLASAVIEEMADLLGETPTIDLALATLRKTLNLPAGGGLALFAIGRTIGWIGHAIEQYEDGRLIRPRARYTGVNPLE